MPKPKGQPKVNRRLKDSEVRAILQGAPEPIKLGFALGQFAGMREGDVVSVEWSSYDGERLEWRAQKNGEECSVRVVGVLKTLLDRAPRSHDKICLSSLGTPWASEGSFRSAFFKTVHKLREKGLVGPGVTFHGTRHTLAAAGRDHGASDFEVSAALGDRSTAMAAIYGADADRKRAQEQVMDHVQKRFADATLETGLETEP